MDRGAMELVWDPRFRAYDFGSEHKSWGGPRSLAVLLMEKGGLLDDTTAVHIRSEVGPAARSDLRRFHFEEYLALVERLSGETGSTMLDDEDTPSFPGCYQAASRVVGGALEALDALSEGRAKRAFHPAGGLHHAHPGRASGFCIFNDVAVVIAKATARGGPFRRVAYVDIDAHHGDGVMYGFYESGQVLDIDFHQDGRTLFPGTGAVEETGRADGAGLKANLPLPPGSGNALFTNLFRRVVPTLLDAFRPDLIVLQHGVDGHTGDRRAGLSYTPESYACATRILIDAADRLCGGKLLVTGGGGYTPSNVSRVLARTGFLLGGRPAPEGALPSGWREMFERELGEPAPGTWLDPGPGENLPRARANSDQLVGELGEALGRSFPRE